MKQHAKTVSQHAEATASRQMHVFPSHDDLAVIRAQKPTDVFEQHAFTRAAAAHHHENLTRVDVEIEILEDHLLSELFVERAQLYEGRCRIHSSTELRK